MPVLEIDSPARPWGSVDTFAKVSLSITVADVGGRMVSGVWVNLLALLVIDILVYRTQHFDKVTILNKQIESKASDQFPKIIITRSWPLNFHKSEAS